MKFDGLVHHGQGLEAENGVRSFRIFFESLQYHVNPSVDYINS